MNTFKNITTFILTVFVLLGIYSVIVTNHDEKVTYQSDTNYAVIGHEYHGLNGTMVEYKLGNACLLANNTYAVTDSNYTQCVNVDRKATTQELKNPVFADDCVADKTFIPCAPKNERHLDAMSVQSYVPAMWEVK